jgi:2-keto-4-pentenoate hydratase/2-oxohepta-3-ene-1,7-dioic acid hydratase in catechol pathway
MLNAVHWDGTAYFPSKIVCVGRNYVGHIKELANELPDEPVIFIKPNSALSDEVHAGEAGSIHFEAEICFIVRTGQLCGVGFGLDLTKREVQDKLKARGLPWERAKAFDRAAVFSPFVTFTGDINRLRLELFINEQLVQQGGCELMLFKPDQLLSAVKRFMTLEDGDVIMSGTPQGTGPFQAGDRFVGKIFAQDALLIEASWLAH